MPLDWDISQVLSGAWNVFQRNWMPLCVGILIVGLIVAGPVMVLYFVAMFGAIAVSQAAAGGDPDAAGVAMALGMVGTFFGIMVLVFLLSPLFTGRLLRMGITAVRGGTPVVGDLFRGEMRYGSMLALMFLQSMAIGLGYMLFIVPGVILAIGTHFASFLVIDQRMGAVDAMKASWRLTNGRKGAVFGVIMVFALVSAGCGFIPFVGHFVGYSLMLLGLSIVYLRLMGEPAPALPAVPAYPPGYGQQAYGQQAYAQQQPYGQQPYQAPYGPPPGPGYGGPYGGGGYGPPPGGPR